MTPAVAVAILAGVVIGLTIAVLVLAGVYTLARLR